MTRTAMRSPLSSTFLHGLVLCLVAGATTLPAQDAPVKGMGKGYHITARQGAEASQLVEFNLDRYAVDAVEEGGKIYSRVDCQGGVLTDRKGFAELPFFHASLQLAQAQKCRVVIEDESHIDIALDHPMMPSKGVVYRNENPSTIERTIAQESLKGGWYPAAVAKVADPFTFRDVQGVNVYLRPFQYDAAKRTLRVYTRMVVRVEPVGEIMAQAFSAPRKRVAEMESVYQSLFLNPPVVQAAQWSHEVGEVGDILVIYTARDASAIQPYIQWKREKGHKVKAVQVAAGTNVKSLIQQEYAANPGLLYVQLVGDWADIKSDIGTSDRKPMDPVLGCVTGSDAYAELIIGRFSASSAAHVTTQINKAINYEKNPDLSGTWYKKGLVIASSEGAGQGDDGESDIQHETHIRNERLLRTTFSDVSRALGDTSTKSMISGPVNAGLSVINYTGHGGVTSWGTTGFNSSDVSALTNGSKLPVICSVACVVGSFETDCFAEAWLRNPNGGAVAGMFSTIYQPWTPPMRGQDYFNDLLTGGYDYASRPGDGTSTTYGRSTFGSLAVNASILMYAESGGTGDLETIQSWTTFGDASLQVRTNTAKAIALSNETVKPGSAFSTRVTSGGVGVAKALVSLSRGEQVFSGLTDGSGNITLSHGLTAGTAKLVVTGQNTSTIYRNITLGDSNTVTITIDPTSAAIQTGATKQFTAYVNGSTNTGVTWTCTNGTVSTSGLYTAPATAGTYTVKATSVADTSKSASATVTVSGGSTSSERILNGGFESGTTNWTATSGVIGTHSGQPAYEGTKNAWMCGYGSSHSDTLYQQVSIPSTATSAVLSFSMHIDTAETTTTRAYDTLDVMIQSSSGAVLKTLRTFSNLNKNTGYSKQTFDVSAYKGQTIRVAFKAVEDSIKQTSFVVDKVSLIAQ